MAFGSDLLKTGRVSFNEIIEQEKKKSGGGEESKKSSKSSGKASGNNKKNNTAKSGGKQQNSFSPISNVSSPLTQMKERITSGGQSKQSTRNNGPSGGIASAYSPVAGTNDPLARLLNTTRAVGRGNGSFAETGFGSAVRGKDNPWTPSVQLTMQKQGLVGENGFYDVLKTAQKNAQVKRYLQQQDALKEAEERKRKERNSILDRYGISSSEEVLRQIAANNDRISARLHTTVNGQWSKSINKEAKRCPRVPATPAKRNRRCGIEERQRNDVRKFREKIANGMKLAATR